MGYNIFTESNIIKDGLVIYLDGTKIKSYFGSRNTWIDLMGNHSHGTLINEPTFNCGNKGSIAFDEINDSVNFLNPLIGIRKITINASIKIKTGSKNQDIVDSSSNNWHLTMANDNSPYFFNGGPYPSVASVLDDGTWYLLTRVQGTTLDIFINGILGKSRIKNSAVVSSQNAEAAVREVADEFPASASQTTFQLIQAPSADSKVKINMNGSRMSNSAYSWYGTTLTYKPTAYRNYKLGANDNLQMNFYY